MNFKDQIIRDPKIRNGVPVIKGTQVTLKTVLGHLALGDRAENILKTYPELTEEHLKVVTAYAASVAGLDIPDDGPNKNAYLESSGVLKNGLLPEETIVDVIPTVNFQKEIK
jgi:uncharacterized protein (DUF433 family)